MNERRVEKGHVCRRHVRDLGTTSQCLEPYAESAQWAPAFFEVFEDLEDLGKRGQRLAR
jgi:hypothetical protein